MPQFWHPFSLRPFENRAGNRSGLPEISGRRGGIGTLQTRTWKVRVPPKIRDSGQWRGGMEGGWAQDTPSSLQMGWLAGFIGGWTGRRTGRWRGPVEGAKDDRKVGGEAGGEAEGGAAREPGWLRALASALRLPWEVFPWVQSPHRGSPGRCLHSHPAAEARPQSWSGCPSPSQQCPRHRPCWRTQIHLPGTTTQTRRPC